MAQATDNALDVTLATCAKYPALAPDDRLLLEALHRRGLRAEPGVWDDPAFDWSRAPLCIIRSTWDYTTRPVPFLAWAERVSALTRLSNPLEVIRWNHHKSYLNDLARRGLPVVPTLCFAAASSADLAALLARHGWSDVVIKPAVSATSRETLRLAASGLTAAQAHVDHLLLAEDMLVQPFLPSIEREGELSLLFVEGEFTHAVRKRPVPGEYRVQDEFGGSMDLVSAQPEELHLAAAILAACRPDLLYARVDLVRDLQGRLCLIELELIEPMLYLRQHPPAAERLAEAIGRRLAQ